MLTDFPDGSSRGAFVRAIQYVLWSMLTCWVTSVIQVYGGAISVVIGGNLWSLTSFRGSSNVSEDTTVASGISGVFNNCRLYSTVALSLTNDEGATFAFFFSQFLCL